MRTQHRQRGSIHQRGAQRRKRAHRNGSTEDSARTLFLRGRGVEAHCGAHRKIRSGRELRLRKELPLSQRLPHRGRQARFRSGNGGKALGGEGDTRQPRHHLELHFDNGRLRRRRRKDERLFQGALRERARDENSLRGTEEAHELLRFRRA